jgi:very-short-patch-repair endonuclease
MRPLTVSLSDARRLLTARGYKVGPVKATIRAAARTLAKAKREHYEIVLGLQLDRAEIVYERQKQITPGRRWRTDFWIDGEPPLLVEVDGGTWLPYAHHGRGGYELDRERDAAALCSGLLVLRVTPGQVTSGKALEWVTAILERWQG